MEIVFDSAKSDRLLGHHHHIPSPQHNALLQFLALLDDAIGK
jgi:hypothetical protein